MAIKNKREKARFGLVGVANTALDFGILFGLHALGVNSLVANFFSTSAAFVFSFFANRKFTFKSSGDMKRQFPSFLLVTLAGLWIIQPFIIWATEPLFVSFGLIAWMSLFGAKLLATVASLTWNYILYSRLVFKVE